MEIKEALNQALDKIAEVIAAAMSSASREIQRTLTTSCSNFTTSVQNVSFCDDMDTSQSLWNIREDLEKETQQRSIDCLDRSLLVVFSNQLFPKRVYVWMYGNPRFRSCRPSCWPPYQLRRQQSTPTSSSILLTLLSLFLSCQPAQPLRSQIWRWVDFSIIWSPHWTITLTHTVDGSHSYHIYCNLSLIVRV